jgi:hypothetical protein
VNCDYDMMIGAEIRTAVAQVARWRRCQAIFIERQAAVPWWRWWQSDRVEKLLGLGDTFSFLAFPGVGVPDVPAETPPASSTPGEFISKSLFH